MRRALGACVRADGADRQHAVAQRPRRELRGAHRHERITRSVADRAARRHARIRYGIGGAGAVGDERSVAEHCDIGRCDAGELARVDGEGREVRRRRTRRGRRGDRDLLAEQREPGRRCTRGLRRHRQRTRDARGHLDLRLHRHCGRRTCATRVGGDDIATRHRRAHVAREHFVGRARAAEVAGRVGRVHVEHVHARRRGVDRRTRRDRAVARGEARTAGVRARVGRGHVLAERELRAVDRCTDRDRGRRRVGCVQRRVEPDHSDDLAPVVEANSGRHVGVRRRPVEAGRAVPGPFRRRRADRETGRLQDRAGDTRQAGDRQRDDRLAHAVLVEADELAGSGREVEVHAGGCRQVHRGHEERVGTEVLGPRLVLQRVGARQPFGRQRRDRGGRSRFGRREHAARVDVVSDERRGRDHRVGVRHRRGVAFEVSAGERERVRSQCRRVEQRTGAECPGARLEARFVVEARPRRGHVLALPRTASPLAGV